MTTIFRVTLLLLVTLGVQASDSVPGARAMKYQPVRFGEYEVHYSAFNSKFIGPDIAEQYHLRRDGRYGILNIAIRKLQESGADEAVAGQIRGKTGNLLGQNKALDFREIREKGAVYYLAGFQFSGEELLKFTFDVTPEGSSQTETIQFVQKFYQEE